MKCAKCDTEMVEGYVGKGKPMHLRFVPNDHKGFVLDYARIIAHACPGCGGVQFVTDPESLRATLSVDAAMPT